MDQDELELVLELRSRFIQDLVDELTSCEDFLLEFEKSKSMDSLKECQRLLHSNKGTASYLELPALASHIHSLEALISKAENNEDVVDQCLKILEQLRLAAPGISLEDASDFPAIPSLAS